MSDKNIYSLYEVDSGKTLALDVIGVSEANPQWDDTLKITSGCERLFIRIGVIWGGREDCVDINNGANRIGVAAHFAPQGKYLATIKGGASGITLAGSVSQQGGTEVDIDLGNWSDQSSKKVAGVSLNLAKQNGSPVTIRVLNSDKPTILGGGPYEYVWPRPDAWYHGMVVKTMLLLGKIGLLKYL